MCGDRRKQTCVLRPMRRLRSPRAGLILLLGWSSTAFAQQTLAALKDKHRVLLVFARSDRDPRFLEQAKLLSHHGAELQERDLVVIPVVTEMGPQITPDTLRVIRGPGLSDEEQRLIRQRFQIAPEAFAVVLLGKDGGGKLRLTSPVSIGCLSQTIDAMPMRKDEMLGCKPQ